MIGKDFAQHLFSLRDRVAFVTGAGSGIGQTIACSLASAGARVVCFDLRDDGGLAETVSHIESIGGQACSFTGDVRQIADLRAAVALAKSRYGRLDIAVNAAGIANANPALEMESEQWQRVIDINLTGVWNSCKAEAELMLESGGGSIINIASMLSFQGGIRVPSYTASKSAVMGVTRLLANEWAKHGINVNALAPGYMATNNTQQLRADEQRSSEILDRIPAGRWGLPSDLMGPVVFLASSASDYINGYTVAVDGGWLAR